MSKHAFFWAVFLAPFAIAFSTYAAFDLKWQSVVAAVLVSAAFAFNASSATKRWTRW